MHPPPTPPDQNEHHDERGSARYVERHDNKSHGESFIELFATRMTGGGIYLLDEPEAPLSPTRQVALLIHMVKATAQGAQFVIATHSPILLGFPGARIYGFDETLSTPSTVTSWTSLGVPLRTSARATGSAVARS